MTTDRYSDDHKIVVGGGSGTLTVDATLAVEDLSISNISSEGDINIESTGGDRNLTTDSGVVSINDFQISGNGYLNHINYPFEIFWHSSYMSNSWYFDKNTTFFFKEDATYYNLAVSANNLYFSSRDDVYIRGGIDAGDSTLWLSANNDSSPYIRLKKDTDTVDIVADTINITQTAKTNTVVIPASAFKVIDKYAVYPDPGDESTNTSLDVGDGDLLRHTNNGNIIFSIDTVGSGYVWAHFFAPFPESIPDGSTITNIGCSLDRSVTGNHLGTYCSIREYDFRYEDGAPGEDDPAEVIAAFSSNSTGHESFYTDRTSGGSAINMTIDKKNKGYTLKVVFHLEQGAGRNNIYLTSFKIGYTTTKLDPNI